MVTQGTETCPLTDIGLFVQQLAVRCDHRGLEVEAQVKDEVDIDAQVQPEPCRPQHHVVAEANAIRQHSGDVEQEYRLDEIPVAPKVGVWRDHPAFLHLSHRRAERVNHLRLEERVPPSLEIRDADRLRSVPARRVHALDLAKQLALLLLVQFEA
jgi:hypothetical protein